MNYDRKMDSAALETFLADHGIGYSKIEHPPVMTCEEARAILPENRDGFDTKNLFLRDKKGARHVLAVIGHECQADLKALAKLLGVQSVSFASPDRLKQCLGVEPGSVTLMGLVHAPDHAVEVLIDEDVWSAPAIRCHPLRNTASLVIAHAGIEAFLQATGHVPRVLTIPRR